MEAIPGRRLGEVGGALKKEAKPYKVALLRLLLWVLGLHPARTPINTKKSPRTVSPEGRRWE